MLKLNVDTGWENFHGYDMESMGWLFERAGNLMKVDMDVWVPLWMKSPYRELMEKWHANFSNCDSSDLFDWFQADFPTKLNVSKDAYYPDELRWIGEAYAYVRYITGLKSSEIIDLVPFREMQKMYICGHQVSWDKFAEFITE